MPRANFIDRVVGYISPERGLARERARFRMAQLAEMRNEYDGATRTRRATGWRRTARDADGEIGPASKLLRETARDMVRNNPHASAALNALATAIVGPGITFQVKRNGVVDEKLTKLAREHFDSTACDADGRHNLYGQQLLAVRSMIEGGAAIIRNRPRRMTDGLAVPMQLQVLEPDYLDPARHGQINDGLQVYGVEFDQLGARRGYWLYRAHPGSNVGKTIGSVFVPARDVVHLFRVDRAGQQHGASWFAPVVLRARDFADFEDAELMKNKIAACHVGVIVGDSDADVSRLAAAATAAGDEDDVDTMEPGMIWHAPEGRRIEFNSPPSNQSYEPYTRVSLRAIMAGLGVPYEEGTGDLSNVSFISGRLGRLSYHARIDTWQWLTVIPQLCDPVGRWFLRAAALAGHDVAGASFEWTPPRRVLMDPATEYAAERDAIRSGQKNLSEVLRERGVDPDVHLAERAADNEALDKAGIVIDCDPRKVTSVGNATALPSPVRETSK